jgi:hypothetical protein
MICHLRTRAVLPAVSLVLLTSAAIGYSLTARADEPPPAATAPENDGGKHHHNPAYTACKKQADDQKLAPGDARHDFMKNCMKSAQGSAPTTS